MNKDEKAEAAGNWQSVRLLTVPEVAAWARVHPKTVYRWIKDGRLNALRLGNRTYRITEPDVKQFLASIGFGNLLPPPSKTKSVG